MLISLIKKDQKTIKFSLLLGQRKMADIKIKQILFFAFYEQKSFSLAAGLLKPLTLPMLIAVKHRSRYDLV